MSVDDLEGLEMTLEMLADIDAVARISESLAALGRGEPGADIVQAVRQASAWVHASSRTGCVTTPMAATLVHTSDTVIDRLITT